MVELSNGYNSQDGVQSSKRVRYAFLPVKRCPTTYNRSYSLTVCASKTLPKLMQVFADNYTPKPFNELKLPELSKLRSGTDRGLDEVSYMLHSSIMSSVKLDDRVIKCVSTYWVIDSFGHKAIAIVIAPSNNKRLRSELWSELWCSPWYEQCSHSGLYKSLQMTRTRSPN